MAMDVVTRTRAELFAATAAAGGTTLLGAFYDAIFIMVLGIVALSASAFMLGIAWAECGESAQPEIDSNPRRTVT